jgi:hypothetical protein
MNLKMKGKKSFGCHDKNPLKKSFIETRKMGNCKYETGSIIRTYLVQSWYGLFSKNYTIRKPGKSYCRGRIIQYVNQGSLTVGEELYNT